MQNKIKSVIAIFILTLSIPMLQTHKTLETDPTYLKAINPLTGDGWFNFTTDTTMAGDTFVVNVTVADVTDLQIWQIHVRWNPTILQYVNIWLPTDNVFAGSGKSLITPPPTVDPDGGGVTFGATYINGDPGTPEYWTFNGTGTLCQMTLRIAQAVSRRLVEVSCPLAFANVPYETFLFDGGGYDIAFTAVDGFYDYKYIPQEILISIVDAVTGSNKITLGTPGQPVPPEGYPFTVNVRLDGLTEDLNTFQIAVSFDKSRISCTGYSFDTPDYVFYNMGTLGGGMICNNQGYAVLGDTILGVPPQNPPTIYNGTLCQIDFIATATGTSTLNIIPTQDICWVPVDDSFLWTPYETPFTSRGLSVLCGVGTVQPPPISIGGNDYVISIEGNVAITDVTATRNTLHFSTSGPPGGTGYINTTIPVGLNKTAITVFIDKVKLTPPPYPVITTNGTHYFVYFEFTLSTHDVDIQYAIADITATNLTQAKTLVGQGYATRINATMQNQGDYEETFNVTVYADSFHDSFDVWNYTGAWKYRDPEAAEGYVSVSDGMLHVSGWYQPGYHDGGLTTIKEFNYPITVETKLRANSDYLSPALDFGQIWQPGYIGTSYDGNVGGWHTGYIDATGYHDVVSGGSITVGTWYTLKFVVTETDFKVYLDDALKVERDWSPPQECTRTVGLRTTYGSYGSGDFDWVKIGTEIETQTVTLTSGNSTTITFAWNTTGFPKGNYTISAYAWPVPDEIDLDDNTLIGGVVSVGVPCDVTGPTPSVPDGVCNMRDIGYFCSKFMTNDPNCDVTGPTTRSPDGIVNMRDIGEACNNFMKKDP